MLLATIGRIVIDAYLQIRPESSDKFGPPAKLNIQQLQSGSEQRLNLACAALICLPRARLSTQWPLLSIIAAHRSNDNSI